MNTQAPSDLFELLDVEDFQKRIIDGYNDGSAELELEADLSVARSIIPPSTAQYRDFSYIGPDIPAFSQEDCVACMECVTECPDTAILAKVVGEEDYNSRLDEADEETTERLKHHLSETKKFHTVPAKKGIEPGMFGIFVDPSKCKGCGECVEVCGEHDALKMVEKEEMGLDWYRKSFQLYRDLPATDDKYINEKILIDMMLSQGAVDSFTGGHGACMGCGEVTALRMMLAATHFVYGPEAIGLVAATGCNTVYASTYPYNPYQAPWMNSLFENAATTAAGVRLRWDQAGFADKKVWAIGGDGGMLDIGLQAMSRVLASGMNINILILDTQVYSNTGGQTSTATFHGQESKLSMHGKAKPGKTEHRKEAAQIVMMHPDVFVAQTTPAHINHFYRSIMAANEYEGPSVVIVYTTCQPEHGVGDDMSSHQAKLAVETRTYPLLVHDPRNGDLLSERLSLKGNPALKENWAQRDGKDLTFIDFASTEGRFRKHFDANGSPSETMKAAEKDRLKNWRQLQEMAGLI